MKLKTLKDFGKIYAEFDRTHNDYSDPNVSVKELKTEAIKWVKRHQVMAMETHMVEDWIKHFFNISQSDIKQLNEGERANE